MEGKDTVGGVVGKNKGEVRECSASGEIHGELSVGGIAGENNGFLAECRNEADVNTEYEEKKQELSDIDTDAAAILEKYRISKENTERSNLTYTDIGGVVGFSDGVVQGLSLIHIFLLLSDPVSFFLSYEGLLSGSLLFSEKVCSHHLPEACLLYTSRCV